MSNSGYHHGDQDGFATNFRILESVSIFQARDKSIYRLIAEIALGLLLRLVCTLALVGSVFVLMAIIVGFSITTKLYVFVILAHIGLRATMRNGLIYYYLGISQRAVTIRFGLNHVRDACEKRISLR